MSTPESLVHMAGLISLVLLLVALVMAVIRVIAGPSLADRVLGLDLMVSLAIGFIAVIAAITGHPVYIDIALALALVGFLATIAFARFMTSRAQGSSGQGWPKAPAATPDRTHRKGQRKPVEKPDEARIGGNRGKPGTEKGRPGGGKHR